MHTAHCDQCDRYEKAVMAKAADEALPPDVVPCAKFEMSQTFRDWAVDQMRKEVMQQVSKAGLDRMAVVKASPHDSQNADEPKRKTGK